MLIKILLFVSTLIVLFTIWKILNLLHSSIYMEKTEKILILIGIISFVIMWFMIVITYGIPILDPKIVHFCSILSIIVGVIALLSFAYWILLFIFFPYIRYLKFLRTQKHLRKKSVKESLKHQNEKNQKF